jgi:xanthine dehydrogenase accessory factor
VKTVFESLIESGVESSKLEKVYSPIGLNIHAETPEEIAVAIMAQIIQIKNLNKGTTGFPKEILEEIVNSEHENIRKALITIISKKGSAPREVGTKMLVLEDGSTVGTIGGGCVEASMLNNALHCIKTQKATVIENDMTGRDAEEEGMVCGGIIKMLIEPIKTGEIN